MEEDPLARLTDVLDRSGVVSALLFDRDVDTASGHELEVALWLDPGWAPLRRLAFGKALFADVVDALGTDLVDVVVLNNASKTLRERVEREGELLLDRDPEVRLALERDQTQIARQASRRRRFQRSRGGSTSSAGRARRTRVRHG
ncbi:MAG: hypothetical protein J2O48_11695 [Solirubrobacterales bacterium]|nr:hypothetical protein [Solirubrobacterales bacterium]